MSLLLWAIFGSHGPKFEVEAFSVPMFDINDTSLRASWAANVTVTNPNEKLTLSFGHIESRLVYKEFLLDTSIVEPVNVDKDDQGSMISKFAVPSPDYDSNKLQHHPIICAIVFLFISRASYSPSIRT
ncbi:hypothetical protein Leryth_002429 [Lithospermum erythrorhizon]|nr:hypothetical protein Leryth_002429 [Lithospermum erythrorhizon]